jgi:hypothetical protein
MMMMVWFFVRFLQNNETEVDIVTNFDGMMSDIILYFIVF